MKSSAILQALVERVGKTSNYCKNDPWLFRMSKGKDKRGMLKMDKGFKIEIEGVENNKSGEMNFNQVSLIRPLSQHACRCVKDKRSKLVMSCMSR